jgi:hypothetical protein
MQKSSYIGTILKMGDSIINFLLSDNSKEFPGRASVCTGEQFLVNGMKEFQCVKTRRATSNNIII